MSRSDAQAIRDAHAALLELERAGLAKPDPLEARVAALEAQIAALTEQRLVAPGRLYVLPGAKRKKR